VTLSSAPCATSTWISTTAASCAPTAMYDADPPRDVTSYVTVGGVAGTAAGAFSFDASVVSSVQLNMPLSGSASLTVSGLNFGVGEQTASLSLERGGRNDLGVCLTASWLSSTTVACLSNPLGDLFRAATMTVNEFVGTGVAIFSFDAAVASDVTRNTPHSGYSSLTVSVSTSALLTQQRQRASSEGAGATVATVSRRHGWLPQL
jgi:hypothetical protein